MDKVISKKYIANVFTQSSRVYYEYLVDKHKGFSETTVEEIEFTEPFCYKLKLSNQLLSDEPIIKVRGRFLEPFEVNIITTKEKNVIFIRIARHISPLFNKIDTQEIVILSDLKFLVKRVWDFYKNNGTDFYLERKEPIFKTHNIDYSSLNLTTSQKKAVTTALQSPLSYIWGAPGTGKTRHVLASCIINYIRYIEKLNLKDQKIYLVAPTNISLEQMLFGVLDEIKKFKMREICFLRLGKASYKFSAMYPEVCESSDISEAIEIKSALEPYILKYNLYNKLKGIRSELEIKKSSFDTLCDKITDLDSKINNTYDTIHNLSKSIDSWSKDINSYTKYLNKFYVKFLRKKRENAEAALERLYILKTGALNQMQEEKEKNTSYKQQSDKYIEEKNDLISEINTLCINTAQLLNLKNTKYAYVFNKIEKTIYDLEISIEACKKDFPEFQNMNSKELKNLLYSLTEKIEKYQGKKYIIAMTLDKFIAIHPLPKKTNPKPLHIFFDEACYSSLAKAFTLMYTECPITMLGDHMQLPPVCEMPDNEFENKINSIAYTWAQSGIFLEDVFYKEYEEMLKDYLNGIEPNFKLINKANLTETHRFGNNLSNVLNKFIYKNNLKSVSENETQIYYVDSGKAQYTKNKRENISEVNTIQSILDDFINEDYVVVSPYKNQVDLIKSTTGIPNVLTVHKTQGNEWDIVILSVVDTFNKFFTDINNSASKGKMLINTALSRAKKEIIIVCDYSYWIEQNNQIITELLKIGTKLK